MSLNVSLKALPRFIGIISVIISCIAICFATLFTTPVRASADTATEPITAYYAQTSDMTTLDPQRAEDATAIDPIENLFLGLTDIDPKAPHEVRPEVAKDWSSKDGIVWTFNLRSDVYWVQWDAAAKKATQLRPVTAKDFEYGIKRACDPRLASAYGKIASTVIKGCDTVITMKPDGFQESSLDQVAVKAVTDTQLEVTLQAPLAYFESMSSLWVFRAVPKEIIEKYGDQWIQPGKIVTDGYFMLDTWEKNAHRVFVRNPYLPKDFQNTYGGNLDRVDITVVGDNTTIYNKFKNNAVDVSPVPASEQQAILADPDLKKQVKRHYDLVVDYFGFAYDKPPFDNVHARRAFSAIIDRNALQGQLGNRVKSIAHFMPPGIFGSVGINEIGVGDTKNLGFSPDYAKKEFAAAGYKDCSTFPTITIIAGNTTSAEFLRNAANTYLGCDSSKFVIQQVQFQVMQDAIKASNPPAQRPNMWAAIWRPDYPDAQNWMHDVLSCKVDNPFKRPCGALDEKIDAAGKELNSGKRVQIYRDIEDAFFGENGEFTIAPLYTHIVTQIYKAWYTDALESEPVMGGTHWETPHIDQAAQLAARPSQP